MQTWLEISRSAISHNIDTLRSCVPALTLLVPAVKSNAYGHGLLDVASIAREAGVVMLAIQLIEEARLLRERGDRGRLLILGPLLPDEMRAALALDAELAIASLDALDVVARIAAELGVTARIHLKIDTGMSRQGVAADEAERFIAMAQSLPHVSLVGIATHFSSSDDEGADVTDGQRARFDALTPEGVLRHSANSGAVLRGWHDGSDIIRPGIAVYGLYPSDVVCCEMIARGDALTPALTWKTRVMQLKTIPTGASVGYGATWVAKQPTRLAVLPVGYFDGYVRAYGNRASVVIRGQRAPVVGRVSMNFTTVDVTDIPDVTLFDEVVLLGRQGEVAVTADELAEISGTINYEVTTRIRAGLPRIITN